MLGKLVGLFFSSLSKERAGGEALSVKKKHVFLSKKICLSVKKTCHFRSIISALLRKNSLVNAKKCLQKCRLCENLITFA